MSFALTAWEAKQNSIEAGKKLAITNRDNAKIAIENAINKAVSQGQQKVEIDRKYTDQWGCELKDPKNGYLVFDRPENEKVMVSWTHAQAPAHLLKRECCVCMNAECNACFHPCAHTDFCFACARDLKKCPICQTEGYAKQT